MHLLLINCLTCFCGCEWGGRKTLGKAACPKGQVQVMDLMWGLSPSGADSYPETKPLTQVPTLGISSKFLQLSLNPMGLFINYLV